MTQKNYVNVVTLCYLTKENNLKLYKTLVQHFSQKDSHSSTECLVSSSNEEAYLWLNEEYNVIGQETYKEKILQLKGEYFEKYLELSELHYGETIYG